MKNLLSLFLVLIVIKGIAQIMPSFHEVSPDRLLIIYNENDNDENNDGIADSKELALYYKQKRNVPDSNILGLNISVQNYYYYYYNTQWENFWNDMVIPIQNKISALGDTSIYYLLLCDKIPYKLVLPISTNTGRSLDNALVCLNNLGTSTSPNFPTYYNTNPYYESSPTDFTDKGSFSHSYNFSGTNMYLVSRLIGTDIRMNKNLVDMALYAEKYLIFDTVPGYYSGIAYVDNRYGLYDDSTLQAGYHYSPSAYGDFDKDAACIKFFYEDAGIPYRREPYETEIGQESALFTDSTSADSARRAILYGGWYNYGTYHDRWEWLPGSYANDLNSNSGASLRTGNSTFLSGAFANGLTCGTGCIGEPYLSGHSQPDIFMYYFLNGYNFIESAYLAEPKVKWQGIVVGDPLYNPYRSGKVFVKDTIIETAQISFDFESTEKTNIIVDYLCTQENPEIVKAKLLWGENSTYTDTFYYEDIYFAHHQFKLTGLNDSTTYHFNLCVKDPVGNTWCSGDETFTTTGSSSVINADFLSDRELICDSATVNLTNISSGYNSYSWLVNGIIFDTSANTAIMLNIPGTYEISLIADNGQTLDTASKIITVSSPQPVISQLNAALVCDGYDEYQWYFNGSPIAGTNQYFIIATASGEYSVWVKNEYGCEGYSTPLQIVLSSAEEQILMDGTFSYYPNPAEELININFFTSQEAQIQIRITDISGKLQEDIFDGDKNQGNHQYKIKLDKFETGIYFINLSISDRVYRKKMMVIK